MEGSTAASSTSPIRTWAALIPARERRFWARVKGATVAERGGRCPHAGLLLSGRDHPRQ
jgi:hypothetical protein